MVPGSVRVRDEHRIVENEEPQMTTNRTRTITKTPLLVALALAFGLAVSASGCIISDTGDTGPTCSPDLVVSYVILNSATNTPISCAAAGADTVRITVNNFPKDFVCNTGPAVQTVIIPLDSTGSATVYVELFGYGRRLSSVNYPVDVPVGCSGYELPYAAELPVVL
jgi:hypothetical protein